MIHSENEQAIPESLTTTSLGHKGSLGENFLANNCGIGMIHSENDLNAYVRIFSE